MDCPARPLLLDFGSFAKHPSERLLLRLRFEPNLAIYFEPDAYYRAGDVVRVESRPGFAYRALNDGTGGRSAVWPSAAGHQVTSGSVMFETIIAHTEGLDIITNASITHSDAGITASISSWERTDVRALVEAGTDGADYFLYVQVTTTSGDILVGKVKCQVRSGAEALCCG